MARALRAWAINRGGKNSVRILWYGPRTRLVRGIYLTGQELISGQEVALGRFPAATSNSSCLEVNKNCAAVFELN